jgi:CHASE3 domain sensor protein
MLGSIKDKIIRSAGIVVAVLILASATLSFYNQRVMNNALKIEATAAEALDVIKRIYDNIRFIDISIRGYAIMNDEDYLYWTVDVARNHSKETFQILDSILTMQGYAHPINYSEVKAGAEEYNHVFEKMVHLIQMEDFDAFKEILRIDMGLKYWQIYSPFEHDVMAFENGLIRESKIRHEKAVVRNNWVQVFLVLLGIPTIGFVFYTLGVEEKKRLSLILNLKENNEKYLFSDGKQEKSNEKEILETSIINLQKASEFVNQISEGNYDVQWDQHYNEVASFNQNNLAGRLKRMRDEMKRIKEEDRKRLWLTEGLSTFSEVIRHNQHDMSELTLQSLVFLVKYLKSQQGSLYIVEEKEDEVPYLQMAACYAFDRKKHIEQRLEAGEGLVGQAFLEAQTIILKEIPQGYIKITSGLGDSTPNCILIVPFKYNEKVRAIVEIAAFDVFKPYQIEFIEKAGEFLASAISSAQISEKTTNLVKQLQLKTEEMMSQEEEMRQNMEELEATQEAMRRQNAIPTNGDEMLME